MGWKLGRPRFRLSTMVLLVALCAAATWAGMNFLSPTRRLARLLRPGQPAYLRREAASALGGVPSWEAEAAIDVLISTLGDPSPRVREYAISALGTHGGRARRAVPAILAEVGDPDRHVRYSACAVLGMVAPPDDRGPEHEEVVAALRKALGDVDPMNRLVAGISLCQLGDAQSAASVLALCATDPEDEVVAYQARIWIRRLKTTGPLAAALVPLAVSEQPARRRAALDLLIEFAAPETVVAALRGALEADDPEIRRWAGERLEALAPAP
ncbi:HEAT repeat domain-containing protein [Paludisphaera soli]|uniref:HEAT repeat domain-containing protein n=1 Tax=Paludisphaera soli TaxID=2712865 RepID=UPI0013EB2A83|nr:HEAT repeat domain-containing protein [Paludisphaera soli]